MEVEIVNRQRRQTVNLTALLTLTREAIPICLATPGPHERTLPELSIIEVALLSDRSIAPINRKFLGHRGSTDVITFQHGEILVSVDTARTNSLIHGKSLEREIALYVIHGLLHLNGWSDEEPAEARQMQVLQENALNRIIPL